tara:strand:+ start:334 stop:729 length:396 start_codon:yes stop_codon:yes gene_type:complete
MRLGILLLMITIVGCSNEKNIGIKKQGYYCSNENDRIYAYYIYEFVSVESLKEYAMEIDHDLGRTTIQYYFSNNANIPAWELSKSANFKEAQSLMKKYSYNSKYVLLRNKEGKNRFIDCALNPEDYLCNPE